MLPSSSLARNSTQPFAWHRPHPRNTTDPAWLSAQHSPGVLEYVPAPHAMQLAELGAPAAECLSASVQRFCCSLKICTTARDSNVSFQLPPPYVFAPTRPNSQRVFTHQTRSSRSPQSTWCSWQRWWRLSQHMRVILPKPLASTLILSQHPAHNRYLP